MDRQGKIDTFVLATDNIYHVIKFTLQVFQFFSFDVYASWNMKKGREERKGKKVDASEIKYKPDIDSPLIKWRY